MARAIYDKFISKTDSGKTIPGATVRVNAVTSGEPLADLYDSLIGGSTVGNPSVADANGRVTFYLEAGRYTFTITAAGETVTYNDVVISGVGLSEIDASNVVSGVLAVDRVPDLAASKTTSGSFSTARIPNLAASKITSGTLGSARVPDLDASKITSGTFTSGLIPTLSTAQITSGTFSSVRIPNLSADKINSGTFSSDRIPGLAASKITSGEINASRIPSLDAGKTTTGTFSQDRFPSSVPRQNSSIPQSNSNLSTASSAPQDILNLRVSVIEPGRYHYECMFIWNTSSSSGGTLTYYLNGGANFINASTLYTLVDDLGSQSGGFDDDFATITQTPTSSNKSVGLMRGSFECLSASQILDFKASVVTYNGGLINYSSASYLKITKLIERDIS